MPKKAPVLTAADDPWGAGGDPPWAPDPTDPDNESQQAEAPSEHDRMVAEQNGDDPADLKNAASGLDEFHRDTTTNPAPPVKKPRAPSGRRKPATKPVLVANTDPAADLEPSDPGMPNPGGSVSVDADDMHFGETGSIDGIQFHSLDDLTEYLKVMYYGQEGTRKTTNALQMTKTGPGQVLLVNAEGGAKKTPLRKHGVDTARVMVWPPEGERVTFAGLEKLFYRVMSDLMTDPMSWLGTVWDSATDIHQALLDQVVEADIARQTEILAKNQGRRPGNIVLRDRFDTDRDDYKTMSNQFRLLLRKFRELPCHFAVTALLRIDEVGRKPMQGPAVTPAIGTDLMGYMDIVLLTQVARFGDAHVGFAQTAPDATHRAKDRFDVLPLELPNPSFDRIASYVSGALTVDNDPDANLLGTPGPTDAAAKAAVSAAQKLSATATKINDRADKPNPVRDATVATARRVASGKKPVAAGPVPSATADDKPPY